MTDAKKAGEPRVSARKGGAAPERAAAPKGAAAAGESAVRVVLAFSRDYVRDSFARALEGYPGGAEVLLCGSSGEALECAARERPHVVIVDAALEPRDGYEVVQEINSTVPGVSTLVVASEPTPSDFRKALRAGARDMLQLPVEKRDLFVALGAAAEVAGAKRSALQGLTERPAVADAQLERARRIVVFSTKGGTGKTFVATNLAGGLAARGAKVALFDLDLQSGDVSLALGMAPKRTVFDLVQTYTEFDSILLADFMLTHAPTGLHVLPAPLTPEEAEQVTPDDVQRVLDVIGDGYDFVVVDTPPFFEERVLRALDWADEVLLVGSLDLPTIKNLKLSLQSMGLMSYPDEKLRLVMNRADTKVGLDMDDVRRHLGRDVLRSISSSVDVPRALNAGEIVGVEKPKTRVGRELAQLLDDYRKAENGASHGLFGLTRRT